MAITNRCQRGYPGTKWRSAEKLAITSQVSDLLLQCGLEPVKKIEKKYFFRFLGTATQGTFKICNVGPTSLLKASLKLRKIHARSAPVSPRTNSALAIFRYLIYTANKSLLYRYKQPFELLHSDKLSRRIVYRQSSKTARRRRKFWGFGSQNGHFPYKIAS